MALQKVDVLSGFVLIASDLKAISRKQNDCFLEIASFCIVNVSVN